MGILSDKEIRSHMGFGNIVIDPFDEKQLNPNSYDIRLGPNLKVYKPGYGAHLLHSGQMISAEVDFAVGRGRVLDMAHAHDTYDLEIPETGLVLYPNVLYLGHTVERTESKGFVPCITGRSSVARLGLSIHVEAGFGDNGFSGQFVLEMTVVHPLRVYPNVRVGQIYWLRTDTTGAKYEGKYQNQMGVRPSELWRDFVDGKPK